MRRLSSAIFSSRISGAEFATSFAFDSSFAFDEILALTSPDCAAEEVDEASFESAARFALAASAAFDVADVSVLWTWLAWDWLTFIRTSCTRLDC